MAAQNPILLFYFERIHDVTNLTDSSTLTHFRFLRRCRCASPRLSLWKLFEWSLAAGTVTSKQQTSLHFKHLPKT